MTTLNVASGCPELLMATGHYVSGLSLLSELEAREMSEEAKELFSDIKMGDSFIKIDKTYPAFENKITNTFKQILNTKSEVEFIKTLKELLKGRSPIVIKPGLKSTTSLSGEITMSFVTKTMSFTYSNFIVEDPLNKNETRVESSCDVFVFITLYHELVHVLHQELEAAGKIKLIPDDGYVFDEDEFHTPYEVMAIQTGVEGYKQSENYVRELLETPKRKNHRSSDFPPFSEELVKNMNTETKIEALKTYIKAGASTDSKLLAQHLSPDELVQSGALADAAEYKRWSVFSTMLADGKGKRSPESLKMLVCTLKSVLNAAAENGDDELVRIIFEAGEITWSSSMLEPVLLLAVFKGNEKSVQLILEAGKKWSKNQLINSKGIATAQKNNAIVQLILNAEKVK